MRWPGRGSVTVTPKDGVARQRNAGDWPGVQAQGPLSWGKVHVRGCPVMCLSPVSSLWVTRPPVGAGRVVRAALSVDGHLSSGG